MTPADPVRCMCAFDPDGAGPRSPDLFLGTSRSLQRWTGHRLDTVAAASGAIASLLPWDPDGAGPEPPVLVAAGSFFSIGGVAAVGIAAWNGQTWNSLGGGLDGVASALAAFDPDGAGPQPASLYVAGDFRHAGGTPAAGVARWDGSAWNALGSGVTFTAAGGARALAVFDADAGGPAPARLVVAGRFSAAGAVPASNLAQWDGAAWSAMGSGTNAEVSALSALDPTPGSGPRLAIGGAFTQAGGVGTGPVALWDGATYQGSPVGWAAPGSWVLTLIGYDPDGDGPGVQRLVAGGYVTMGGVAAGIAIWDGGAWVPLGGGVAGGVSAMLPFDDDHGGPEPEAIFAGGDFTRAGGLRIPRLARWTGEYWTPPGRSLAASAGLADGPQSCLTIDPDGPGPARDVLLLRGWGPPSFPLPMAARTVPPTTAMVWDGAAWGPSPQLLRSFSDILAIDRPAPGSGTQTVFGRVADAAPPGVPPNSLVLWDGQTWTPLPELPSWIQSASFTHEPGQAAPRLYACFLANGSARLARWDAPAWTILPGEFNSADNDLVRSVIWYDPDLDGPAPGSLVALGCFQSVSGAPLVHAAQWNGSAWGPMGAGLGPAGAYSPGVRGAALLPDLSGPSPRQHIVVVGWVSFQGESPVAERVARWDGTSWSPIDTDIQGPYGPMVVCDDDGPGPAAPALYLGIGALTESAVARLVRWDGAVWTQAGDPITNQHPGDSSILYFRSLATLDDDGDGPIPPAVYAIGRFSHVGDVPSPYFARWGSGSDPRIVAAPNAQTVRSAAGVALRAAAAGTAPLTLRWHRNGEPVFDSSRISGAATETLTIAPVLAADAGNYTLAAQGACGEAVSTGADLVVLCASDWNADGSVNSADIASFLTGWIADVTGGGSAADFDGSGSVNSADISAFLAAWLDAVTAGC